MGDNRAEKPKGAQWSNPDWQKQKVTLIPRTEKTKDENVMIRIQGWLNLKGDRTTAGAASGAGEQKPHPLQKNLPE